MLHVANTIIPVFAIILLGWFLRSRHFLPSGLIGPLNRLVYYLAIPAMIFREVAGASFETHFDLRLVAATLIPLLIIFGISFFVAQFYGVSAEHRGTFMQSSFHGNLGYIGLAVCFYFLGREGFTRASILAGFLMLLQNFLAVLGLQIFSGGNETDGRLLFFGKKIIGNPVILSALAGMSFSLWRIPIPTVIDRALKILGGMALPLALLVIGASLSFKLIQSHLRPALSAGVLKLLVLPAAGLLFYLWFAIPTAQFLPGLILLSAPTATITYVMAGEMRGSTDLATASISMNTLLSALTFTLWLTLVAP